MFTKFHAVDADGARRKRRRIILACEPCRLSKIRCTGERPSCVACNKRGRQGHCNYENHDGDNERRDEFKRRSTPTPKPNQGRGRAQQDQFRLSAEPRQLTPESQRGPDEGRAPHLSIDTHRKPKRPRIAKCDPALNQPIYGGSSASTLLSQLRTACQQRASSQSHLASARKNSTTTYSGGEPMGNSGKDLPVKSRMEIRGEPDPGDLVLPPRHIGDALLASYFNHWHNLIPIVHMPSFTTRYESLYMDSADPDIGSPPDPNTKVLIHILMNLVFAIGSHHVTLLTPHQRSGYGEEFYQRARRLICFEIMDGIDITAIQIYLLTAQYLFYEDTPRYADRCWNTIGMAIRAAQGLGMHLNEVTNHQTTSQLQREMRKRIWYSALYLDRTLSMIVGRPPVYHVAPPVELPQSIDDEYLQNEGEGVQPAGTTSKLEVFIQSIHMSGLLGDILNQQYHQRAGRLPALGGDNRELVESVLALETRIETVRKNIPADVWPTQEKRNTSDDRERLLHSSVFYNRYNYTRQLLYRPVLLASVCQLDEATELLMLPSQKALLACFSNSCVETALNLMANLSGDITDCRHDAHHPWHYIFYAFNSALVLVAGHLSPMAEVTFDDPRMVRAWAQCQAIFTSQAALLPSATEALKFLDSLRGQVYNSHTAEHAASGLHEHGAEITDSAISITGPPTDLSSGGSVTRPLSPPATATLAAAPPVDGGAFLSGGMSMGPAAAGNVGGLGQGFEEMFRGFDFDQLGVVGLSGPETTFWANDWALGLS